MPVKGAKSPNRKRDYGSVLAHLRNSLAFFGLSLLVTESAFATMLWRHSYSDKTVIDLAGLMAALFALSVISVLFLTYKAPDKLLSENATTLLEKERRAEKEAELKQAREQLLRIRDIVVLVLEYKQRGKEDVASLFALLNQAEALLEKPAEQNTGVFLRKPNEQRPIDETSGAD